MKKYEFGTEENKIFLRKLREELFDFGRRFPSPSGASFYLGDDGTPWEDRPRETWITCRMVHVYSMAKLLGDRGAERLVKAGVHGLLHELHDKSAGGWYAGRTKEDGILPDKQCYAHAFVILAASSAVLAGDPDAEALLSDALSVYDRYFWREEDGLCVDTWNTDFTELSDYRGVNANMHTVEAFLAAADVLHEEKYRQRAGRIIEHVILWAEENQWRIPEHFTKDWKPDLDFHREKPDDPFKPYGATPGHGIECARLIVQWAVSVYGEDEDAKEKYIHAAEKLYCRAVSDAWNVDGAPGIVYTTDWEGSPIVRDRMHWTLAEAVNTAAVLFRITKKEQYAKDYAGFMEYLDEVVLDKEHGSWYHQLDEKNQLKNTVWPGKSDLYHAVQSTLIPYNEKTGLSIAAAVAGESV